VLENYRFRHGVQKTKEMTKLKFVSTYTGKRLSDATYKSTLKLTARSPGSRVSCVVKQHTLPTKVAKTKILQEMSREDSSNRSHQLQTKNN